MHFQELFEGRGGSLYHSIATKYAADALKKDRILGTTFHRFLPDGRMLADPDFTYGSSYYFEYQNNREELRVEHPEIVDAYELWEKAHFYIGVSMTRSFTFAKKWKLNNLVFEFDQQRLNQQYRIIPWNWGGHPKLAKRELEEFVVLGRITKDDDRFEDFYLYSSEANPKLKNVDRFLTGIYAPYLGGYSIEIWKENDLAGYEFVTKHPKFKGFVEIPRK